MPDYTLIKELMAAQDPSLKNIALILVILISLNIVVELFRIIPLILLSDKDKKNKKSLMIEERRIKVLEHLFQMLDSLSLYDRENNNEMINKGREITQFITRNKIYIPKEFQKQSYSIIDYFTTIMYDYRKKDVATELLLFDKFCDEFNK